MPVHIPTLFIAIIVVSATLAALLGASARRGQRDGLAYCAAAMAMHGVAYALFGLRGRIDDMASIVLANILLSAVFALFAEGIYQFEGRPSPRRLLWAPTVLVAVAFWALIDDFPRRTIVGGAIFSAQTIVILAALAQGWRNTVGRGQWFLGAGLAALLLMFLIRLGVALAGSAELSSLMASSATQASSFLLVIACLLVMATGLVVMAKERADERNRLMAFEDELTRLPNRRAVLDALDRQLAMARRGRQPLSVLMLDIDHFKRVNDTHGHLVGDEVLREVARRVAARLRGQDVAGRFGGEEFLVILPSTLAEGARQVAESLRLGIAQAPVRTSGGDVPVTISIGVFGGELVPGARPDDLIQGADAMLYQAKNSGRNRVEVGASSA